MNRPKNTPARLRDVGFGIAGGAHHKSRFIASRNDSIPQRPKNRWTGLSIDIISTVMTVRRAQDHPPVLVVDVVPSVNVSW
jgi:hypothetical protein